MSVENSHTVSLEDDEMSVYKKSALSSIRFKIVYNEEDVNVPLNRSNSFRPEMAHQVFGQSEMIFGYKQLSIGLYFLHNSARCYIDLQASGKLKENEVGKADDIMDNIGLWLPAKFRENKEEFLKDLAEEKHDQIFGKILDSFKDVNNRVYKVVLCDIDEVEFQEFHQRYETFMVWFIDGANFIDVADRRWMYFYVYEEYVDEENNKIYRSPVGFTTVYQFFAYPNSIRPRISQFFVLPTHQRKGIGTQFYSIVFNHLKSMENAIDVHVEEPTEIFQKIRDFSDSLMVYKSLKENNLKINSTNEKKMFEHMKLHKLNKKQAQRIVDILKGLFTPKNEYSTFSANIKNRIGSKIEKQTQGGKKICNLQRAGIFVEPMDKNEIIDGEYNKYIESIQWPIARLRKHLELE